MGLDMYLYGKRYLQQRYSDTQPRRQDDDVVDALRSTLPEIKHMHPCWVKIEAAYAYWRKANHIHAWFVNNVQEGQDDCGHYYVDKDDLQKLRDVCDTVIKDPSLAPQLLPTQRCFFFGGTLYGEYYLEQTRYTRDVLEKLLNDDELKLWEWEYHSSW